MRHGANDSTRDRYRFQHVLSPSYDPAYLELAIRKRQPLAIRDAELVGAGVRCGLEVLTA